MILFTRRAFAAGLLLASVVAAQAQIEPQRQKQFPPVEAVTAQHGMVVTQEARASRIGADILKRGGNAVDAAVAVGFTMAVTYPRAGNIGGGGFMVIHLAGTKRKRARDIAIDYRETAPAATTRDVFLGPDGRPDPAKSRDQGLAIGVPGTVAGLTLALQKYGSGKFTLAQLMEPAITLARDGYQTGDEISDTARSSMARLARWPSSAKLFLKPDGTMLDRGTLFVQSDLAATLDGIARNGPRAFYEGAVADKISAAVREAGGRMTYNAVKAAEISLGKSLAQQLAKDAIRVVSVAPGSILFPGGSWDKRRQADPDGIAAFVARELPFGRFGTLEEVGDTVAFLASPRASWIAGTAVVVDGCQSRMF